MTHWETLLTRPADLADDAGWDGWLTAVATALLNDTDLMVAGRPHRFTEVEAYYCGPGHDDRFAHRDPVQLQRGHWYFHRTGGQYRSGSFKGLDLAFGDGTAHAGFLIRGIEPEGGDLIDGPSLCVDHLLRETKHADVAVLDKSVGGRPAWGTESLLHVRKAAAPRQHQVFRSGRVGLSLKKAKPTSDLPRFILRPYRYLTEPKRIKKGKPYLVLALHAQGVPADEIAAVTGSPKGTVARYVEDFEAGQAAADFGPYFGAELGPKDLCRLHGTWHKLMGGQA